MSRIEYVAGLLFDQSSTKVALVRKAKPAWQAGRLNAIGGKIEPGERPYDAMEREFTEETGVSWLPWFHFASLTGPDFAVHFFQAHGDPLACRTMEIEQIEVWAVTDALADLSLIPNLKVLIPLALDNTGIAKPVLLSDERVAA